MIAYDENLPRREVQTAGAAWLLKYTSILVDISIYRVYFSYGER